MKSMNEMDGKKLSIYVTDGFSAFFFVAANVMLLGGLCGYLKTPGPKSIFMIFGSLLLAVANSGVLFKTLKRLIKKPSCASRMHWEWLETQRQAEARSWAVMLPLLTIGAIGLSALVSRQVLLVILTFCLLRSLPQFLYKIRRPLSYKAQNVLEGFRKALNFSGWVFFVFWGVYSLVTFQSLSKGSVIDFSILLFYWAVLVQKSRFHRPDLDLPLFFSEETDPLSIGIIDPGMIALESDREWRLKGFLKHKQKS